MILTWYKIFNATDFEALDIPSKTYTLVLEDIGQKDILVTKGVSLGITYEDVFLPLDLNGVVPFVFEGFAIYKDELQDVYLGIEVEE